MTTKIMSLLLLISMGFIACKKESTTPNNPSQDKIIGKWKLQSTITNDFYAGTSHISTYTGMAADYADFRTDGKVYSFINNNYDTSAYVKISDTKVWIDAPTYIFDIQTLTDTQLKLYRKETYSATEYYESTLSFTR